MTEQQHKTAFPEAARGHGPRIRSLLWLLAAPPCSPQVSSGAAEPRKVRLPPSHRATLASPGARPSSGAAPASAPSWPPRLFPPNSTGMFSGLGRHPPPTLRRPPTGSSPPPQLPSSGREGGGGDSPQKPPLGTHHQWETRGPRPALPHSQVSLLWGLGLNHRRVSGFLALLGPQNQPALSPQELHHVLDHHGDVPPGVHHLFSQAREDRKALPPVLFCAGHSDREEQRQRARGL